MKCERNFFKKDYWAGSLQHFKNVRSITLMSLFLSAILIVGGVLSLSPIIIMDRRISIMFILWGIFGMIFGPITTMFMAGIANMLIFFMFPKGYPFYIGYLFTDMLMGFIMGLTFYKKDIKIIPILVNRIIINLGIHVGIESFFMKDIMKYNQEAFTTYVVSGTIKNVIMIPIEIILIILIFIPIQKILITNNVICSPKLNNSKNDVI